MKVCVRWLLRVYVCVRERERERGERRERERGCNHALLRDARFCRIMKKREKSESGWLIEVERMNRQDRECERQRTI